MSPAHSPEVEHDGPHEGPIRTPKQLVAAVLASFVVPIAVIVLLVNYVDIGARPGAGSTALEEDAVARRLRPVGSVVVRDASAPAPLRSGEQVYQGQCAACHAIGAAGSPKFGDAQAWAPRIQSGFDALLNSALKGKNAMPPQGGGQFSDVEVGRGVAYMANQAGARFEEPQARQAGPAAAASQAAGGGAPK